MDDEYFKRYAELREMVKECYVDQYILLGMRNFNDDYDKVEKMPNCILRIINHHCRLTKEHIALTLWKLTDIQKESNTIVTLKTYLWKNYEVHSSNLSKENREYREQKLTPIRKKMLAHNDIENSGVELHIDELFRYLEDVKNVLNRLCYETIDNRVKPLSDAEIFNIRLCYQPNLHSLYSYLSLLNEDDASN